MRRFVRPGKFNLACNLFSSFGYFEREEDNLQVLRNLCESLAGGGVLVMEMLGKERLARVWKDSICADLPDGSVLLQRPRVGENWTRVHNQWRLIKEGTARSFEFQHYIYSGRELQDRLMVAGFKSLELYGDLQGLPYGLDALRLVAVARK